MDYIFVNCKNIDNLNRDNQEIRFEYTPSEDVNFFESSIILDINLNVVTDSLDAVQLEPYLAQQSGKVNFNKFFIYKIFKSVMYQENNVKICENQNVYDYVRMKNIFKTPMNKLYGFECIKLDEKTVYDYKLHFIIPLKCIFSEFEDLFYYSDTQKTITMRLQNIMNIANYKKDLFEKNDYKFKVSKSNIKNMILKIPLRYEESEHIIFKQIGQGFRKTEVGNYYLSGESVMNTEIPIGTKEFKPISFCFMLKDDSDRILEINKELSDIQLRINSVNYPNYDMNIENYYDIGNLYEMYIRYIDSYYGNNSNYLALNFNNYYTFDEFKKHPIICFCLAELPDKKYYEIFAKIKFLTGRKTASIAYLYTYIDTIN
ncbi:hypothetical protein AHEVV1_004 [Adoxophyes honmai entomopoxvirus 'L' virophage 1]|nr:hypothetical protein AHEVV1_004 [Adoxophyes honmai entomopoxvirus 'L' virophage 1]